ncbi:hypothetical protein CF138_17230 [Aeromonas hydrophila]|uniref:GIY-YIG nuclease family protein n=1 Tax=Aeromonas TaxID=642 RepID=UPI001117ADA0|nr:GIY-YIG nuclease family protein [Aeromonas hydrophila]TNH82843.1 hypothetical protein CF138_17230 [Aeromonas hydrophila]TNI00228.1 hypothetical protein CF136_10535 [Aeromonas hydrophila]TNI92891.1 hypothetical protein CF118_18105 [Aeromonas hydrophila]
MICIQEQLLPPADRGYIYFAKMTIDGDSFYKIGYSRNPQRRFQTDEFDDVDAHVEFKCLVPMMDWMYEDEYRSEYWELKLHGLLQHNDVQYWPEHEFSGRTECYQLSKQDYNAAVDSLESWLVDMSPKGWRIDY